MEVRKVFHKLWAQAIEPFNGLYKNVFEWRVKMPVKGLQRSQLLTLGAVVVYQLVLLYQHEQHLPLGKGIKPLLRAVSRRGLRRPYPPSTVSVAVVVSAHMWALRKTS